MSTNPASSIHSTLPLLPPPSRVTSLLSLSDIDIRQSASPAIFIAYFNTFLKITCSLPHLDFEHDGIQNRSKVAISVGVSRLVNAPLCLLLSLLYCLAEKLRRIASEISKVSSKLLSLAGCRKNYEARR